MIYVSSDKNRKKNIKRIYKKYNDLPSYIVKPIIEYKLNSLNECDLKSVMTDMRVLNRTIECYESAINGAINANGMERLDLPVIITLREGFTLRITLKRAIEKLELMRIRKNKILQEMRIKHTSRKFTEL